jgi:hypothetical protein
MNRKIFFRGVFGTSILLSSIVIGFRPEPLAKVAGNGSGDTPEATKQQHVVETYGKLPLSFEANVGQTRNQVKFLSRGQGYTLFLTRRAEAVLVLAESPRKRTPAPPTDKLSALVKPQPEAASPAVLRMKLVGAKRTPRVEGLDEFPGKANYFVGNDPKKWRTNVPMYAKVRAHAVYPGVDLVYYGNQRQLEHDFIVAPGADPGAITMVVEGAERLSLDAQGDLVLAMKDGEVRLQKPVVYQEVDGVRQEIPSRYTLKNAHRVGFQIAAYDASRPLTIDPVLAYSTYLGGSGGDGGFGIAVDSSGDAYVTGLTFSSDFPTKNPTAGACVGTCGTTGSNGDVFVTKLTHSGSGLVYSTYLGGSGFDEGRGIAVDSSGDAYVTGGTASSDFPTKNPTAGACVGTCGTTASNGVAFVTKLTPSGNGLVYSTYLGGSGFDEGFGIAVDSSGDAYVTGVTDSSDFPTKNPTAGACVGTCGTAGNIDAFVTKLTPSGNGLVYSTYLGGSGFDEGLGIAVDSSGDAYVTGVTGSSDFPTKNPTAGACVGTCGTTASNGNAFVTKLTPSGSGLVYSTYLGGSGGDEAFGIAVDSSGDAYVTGHTFSSDFPTKNPTAGACVGTCATTASNGVAFVTKLTPSGNGLVYSTYLGGSGGDVGGGIAVDSSGDAYVTGVTTSSDFPTKNPTAGACVGTCGTGTNADAFVTVLNPPGSVLVFSTYLGGSGDEGGLHEQIGFINFDFAGFGAIAVDASLSAYVTGITNSNNFATKNPTPGACVGTCGTGTNSDAFVTKFANITCKPENDDVEGDGHENGDDGREGQFRFCKSSGEMDFEERDSDGKIVGKPLRGKMDAVSVSGSQAIITGSGTLADGTPVNYTAVVLGNQPVISANTFAISWVTATGSVFQTSGPLTDGSIVVEPQQVLNGTF